MEEKQSKRQARIKRFFSVSPLQETMVVLHGEREAIVYGCRKILLYSSPEIRLSVRKKQLCVLGRDLSCSSFSGGTVTVEGKIEEIRYEAVREEGNAR